MARRDETDPMKARGLAWRLLKPGETLELPEPVDLKAQAGRRSGLGDADGLPEDEQALEALRSAAKAECASLATAIDDAWRRPEGSEQEHATAQVVARAVALGSSLAAIHHTPLESVRLARLVARYHPQLPAADVAATLIFLDYGHGEVVDLLVDLARAGDQPMTLALYLALHRELPAIGRRRPELAPRLAEVFDEATRWAQRIVALDWLAVVPSRAVVSTLRRALRLPHLGVRWQALEALLKLDPPGLSEADALFLLEDLVVHPLPDSSVGADDECSLYFAETLTRAVERIRPVGGHAPLARIVVGDCEPHHDWRLFADAVWALELMATVYPAEALPLVDECLRSASAHERMAAARAASRLDAEVARPRLLALAADGAPAVAERARDGWIHLFSHALAVDELAGLDLTVLDRPPSEQLRGRLAMLRGSSEEARLAMAEVLLGEAPDREALALLLFALADDRLGAGVERRRMPRDRDGWCRRLIARFGRPATVGLCDLARRSPGGAVGRWIETFGRLLQERRPAIPRRDWDLVRAFAEEQLDDPAGRRGALAVLLKTGASPSLLPRLWPLLLVADDRRLHGTVGEVLSAWPPSVELDELLVSGLEAAAAASDWRRLGRIARVAAARKPSTALLTSARRMVESIVDVAALRSLAMLCQLLWLAGDLDAAWVLEGLEQPDTFRFLLAVRLSRRLDRSAPLRRLLRRALDAGPEAAALAASELAQMIRGIGSRDPRLPGIIARAPIALRAELLASLRMRGTPLALITEPLLELLTSRDPTSLAMTRESLELILLTRLPNALLRRALPDVTDENHRAVMAHFLKLPAPLDTFWQDIVPDGDAA